MERLTNAMNSQMAKLSNALKPPTIVSSATHAHTYSSAPVRAVCGIRAEVAGAFKPQAGDEEQKTGGGGGVAGGGGMGASQKDSDGMLAAAYASTAHAGPASHGPGEHDVSNGRVAIANRRAGAQEALNVRFERAFSNGIGPFLHPCIYLSIYLYLYVYIISISMYIYVYIS
jgi:hypothetical protein